MAKQEQIQKQHTERDQEEEVDQPPAHVETHVDEGKIDDILDEIDEVLESNAEEFVNGYVQRGGQ